MTNIELKAVEFVDAHLDRMLLEDSMEDGMTFDDWVQYAYIKGYKARELESNWVSVEDRLPEYGNVDLKSDLSVDVLLSDGDYFYTGFANLKTKEFFDEECCPREDVTHWRYIEIPD